jgi:heme-degrading monooxygenase HmoA
MRNTERGRSTVIEYVCEYVVKEESRGLFELAYGPGGAWSKLLDRCPGYHGTTLLRDTVDLRRYLAIDIWDSEAARKQMRVERQAEYASLEATLAGWVESRTEMGAYRVLAEATVRPGARQGRAQAGEPHRLSRQNTR